MKVLEVKNNLVKTDFSSADRVTLGGFLIIEDNRSPYVSQIMNLKQSAEGSIAISKLLFNFDGEGVVREYNGTIPFENAKVSCLDINELLEILPYENPLKIGCIANENSVLTLDRKILDNNFLICSDRQANEQIFLENILNQLKQDSQRSIVFDLDGHFQADNKIKFPKDFKLPLNFDTIEYIYERELNDIDATSKAIIQDILIELQEYSKVAEGHFIPFNSFIEIIDSQYKETKIPQLVLLKNKLSKYKESGIFAQTSDEAFSIRRVLEENNNAVIDLSDADCELMQEQILELVYSILETFDNKVYAFIKLGEENARKPLLKLLTTSSKISTTVICPHNFKYIKELKSLAKNIVFFAPMTTQNDFAAYNTLLNKLNNDEFIITGDLTQNIPFIVKVQIISEKETNNTSVQSLFNDEFFESDNDGFDMNDSGHVNTTYTEPLESYAEPVENNQNSFQSQGFDPVSIAEPVVLDDYSEPVLSDNNSETPVVEEFNQADIEDIVEPDISETIEISEPSEPEIVEDLNSDLDDFDNIGTEIIEELPVPSIEETPEIIEDIPEQNKGDFDDFANSLIHEEPSELPPNNLNSMMMEEEIIHEQKSNPDAYPQDDVASQDNEEKTFSAFEPIPVMDYEDTSSSSSYDENSIPVYPAMEMEEEGDTDFNTGDSVIHPTYGTGTVEKVISYGSKKLCSIMFESNNRRLLDPAISSIRKLKDY